MNHTATWRKTYCAPGCPSVYGFDTFTGACLPAACSRMQEDMVSSCHAALCVGRHASSYSINVWFHILHVAAAQCCTFLACYFCLSCCAELSITVLHAHHACLI